MNDRAEDGEIQERKQSKQKHRSRSGDKKKRKESSKKKDKKKDSRQKDRKHSVQTKDYQRPVERRVDNNKPRVSKVQQQQIEDENRQIEEENKFIAIEMEMDESKLIEIRRQEREELLRRFEQEEQQVQSDSEEKIENQSVVVVVQPPIENKQIDENKQNYLRMLENLRDQEVNGLQDNQEEQGKRQRKEVLDMFDDDDEEDNEIDKKQVVNHTYEFDDEGKYFRINVGEIVNNEYRITDKSGKGVFGNVCKAININSNQEVAIKFLRSEEIYLRSGERERQILQQLNESDKSDKKHILRMYTHFAYKKHLCIVLDSMDMNLREAIKVYGRGKGLALDAVRSYSMQLFIALQHLKKNKIIHADIKPDNILISKDTRQLRLCDFGTAFPVEEGTLVEYLVSRFYRAPEIIIGYAYDTSIDVWSAACTMFELYTGTFLFPGENNNEMLKLHLQTIGKFSLKLLKRGALVTKYFDQHFTFLSKEKDPVTRQEYLKPLLLGDKPTRDLSKLLRLRETNLSAEENKKLYQFKDLLEKCLQLDPKNRMSPEEALMHPFINIQAQLTKKMN